MTAYPLDDRAHADLDPDTLRAVYRRVEGYLLVDSPEFGSYAWAQLDRSDPAWAAAVIKAALAWWTARVFGDGGPAGARNEAAKAVHAADPQLWRDLAARRAQLGMPLPEYRKRGAA